MIFEFSLIVDLNCALTSIQGPIKARETDPSPNLDHTVKKKGKHITFT